MPAYRYISCRLYRFVSYRQANHLACGDGSIIMRLETRPGQLARFFGAIPKFREFIGQSTVWYTYPGYRRCSTSTEYDLANFWTYICYENIQPT